MTARTLTTSAHDTERGRGTGTELVVDEENAFFFDHPLDHVPAMLMLDSALHAAERLAESPPDGLGVTRLWMRFDRFCEKDLPARILLDDEAAAGPARSVSLRLVQDGTQVCRGGLVTTPDASSGPHFSEPGAGARGPCADARLVHKRAKARVLVGPPHRIDRDTLGTRMLEPEPYTQAAAVHPVTLLVEAGRQASTMIDHTVWNTPLDHQFIVGRLDVSLPTGPAWTALPVLRCRPRRTGTRVHVVTCELMVAGAARGSVTFTGRTVPPAAYRRLRAGARNRSAATGTGPRETAR
ncbi:AfsA-related hotdog domain-containing protein [Streptomyces massasporeus]|uniref:AfsA-related hotdog domain-containing protein n=1 Tax=Streptomyces massasporeus TaxID=67324 RepID=UPI0033B89F62